MMRKLIVLLAILAAVSISPVAVYAHNHNHDRGQHEQMWREHEQEWRDHDREWREHSGDHHWKKEHAKKWHEWYKWHESNETEFHLRVSDDGFELDINL